MPFCACKVAWCKIHAPPQGDMAHALREITFSPPLFLLTPCFMVSIFKQASHLMSKQSVVDETKTSQFGFPKPTRFRGGFGFPKPGGLLWLRPMIRRHPDPG